MRHTAKTPGLSNRIMIMRLKRGMSQQALARAAGMSLSYAGQLERGYREPTAAKVASLARALGCTTDHLILGR